MNNDVKIEQFFIYIKGIIKKTEKKFNLQLKHYNITNSHSVYMMLLMRHPSGLTMTELSNMSQVDKALTSRVVKELESIEYIYRDAENLNTRNYNICLTKKGYDVANCIEQIMINNKKRILDKFTDEEQQHLHKSIMILINKLTKDKEN